MDLFQRVRRSRFTVRAVQMTSRTSNLGSNRVQMDLFRGLGTPKMTHFGTTFGALWPKRVKSRGVKSDPLNGKMRDLGYSGVSGSGRPDVRNGSKIPHFGVLRRYFEGTSKVLISTFWYLLGRGPLLGPLLDHFWRIRVQTQGPNPTL